MKERVKLSRLSAVDQGSLLTDRKSSQPNLNLSESSCSALKMTQKLQSKWKNRSQNLLLGRATWCSNPLTRRLRQSHKVLLKVLSAIYQSPCPCCQKSLPLSLCHQNVQLIRSVLSNLRDSRCSKNSWLSRWQLALTWSARGEKWFSWRPRIRSRLSKQRIMSLKS